MEHDTLKPTRKRFVCLKLFWVVPMAQDIAFPDDQVVIAEKVNHVRLITLNRPRFEKVARGELSSQGLLLLDLPDTMQSRMKQWGFVYLTMLLFFAGLSFKPKAELGVKKILIVDWDVHHGNGTQKMFWKDPRVLYFSVHRFDFGTFIQVEMMVRDTMVGEGLGAWYNINVPWEHGRVGDAHYLAVWEHILIPRSFGGLKGLKGQDNVSKDPNLRPRTSCRKDKKECPRLLPSLLQMEQQGVA
ncbi:hypothetical protein IFM89_037184 [Coptis chinensis]|uniref:Histone deacetylase domain-containing protein n=1 Tax=Coptis chinensis TaxID=261450 RepID=A0A835LQF7_9MAGN|nr:hypothetical protein IFM89_037184 [Coptis chinensis]